MLVQISVHDGEQSVSIVDEDSGESYIAHADHPRYERIRDLALDENPEVYDLFSLAPLVGSRFKNITDQITVQDNRLYFDHEEITGPLAEQLVRAIEEDDTITWIALANFYQKLASNPSANSREQLFEWLRDNPSFQITPEGDILGYKGVSPDLQSRWSGRAIVNGEVVKGQITYAVGAVVEMPRGQVVEDKHDPCAVGLHVATESFARAFAGGTVVSVVVNPRDVVSVPTRETKKMRVCRLGVKEIVKAPYADSVVVGNVPEKKFRPSNPSPNKSVLDENKEIAQGITKRVKEGKTKVEITTWLSTKGIKTTKDSLRRFCLRHNIV